MALFGKHKQDTIAFAANASAISVSQIDSSDIDHRKVIKIGEERFETDTAEEQLKSLVDKQKLKRKPCATCLDLNEYRLVPMDAPNVPEEELAEALKWGVAEYIDTPIDDVVIEYFDLPRNSNTRNARNLNVVVVDKKTITDKVSLFEQAGLKLNTIDIPELAIKNLINAYHLDNEGTVFLYLAKTRGLIVFVRDNRLYFSRTLDIGTEHLLQNNETQQNIALEIQRSLDFFERYYINIGMKRLVVAPTSPAFPKLARYLNESLAISCESFDFGKGLTWEEGLDKPVQPASILALGTALRIEEKNETTNQSL